MRYCTHCGNPIPDGARFCTGCGTPVHPVVSARPSDDGRGIVIDAPEDAQVVISDAVESVAAPEGEGEFVAASWSAPKPAPAQQQPAQPQWQQPQQPAAQWQQPQQPAAQWQPAQPQQPQWQQPTRPVMQQPQWQSAQPRPQTPGAPQKKKAGFGKMLLGLVITILLIAFLLFLNGFLQGIKA